MVSARFDELTLEDGYCQYDNVTLYSGSSANSPSLGTFCILEDTSAITSSGSSLLVIFRSDRSVNSGHFSLNWEFVDKEGPS